MTTLARFTPAARQTVVRAGTLAGEYGQRRLSTDFFVLALAENQPLAKPVELNITAAMIRLEIAARTRARPDRELLATPGIDLDEVRRRAHTARLDDPALWQLHRSRVRPLRITLSGPAADIVLWGLLADASSHSVHILRRAHVDLHRLWTDLRRWHRSAEQPC